MVLMTNNSSNFAQYSIITYLTGMVGKNLSALLRHPCSNGQRGNFLRMSKVAIDFITATTSGELDRGMDTFLTRYISTKHSVENDT